MCATGSNPIPCLVSVLDLEKLRKGAPSTEGRVASAVGGATASWGTATWVAVVITAVLASLGTAFGIGWSIQTATGTPST